MREIFILNDMQVVGVNNIPLLGIEYLPSNIDLSKYDALLFTSKNAIYSLNSFNSQWKKIPSYAIAKKTQKVIEVNGGVVEFVGNSGHGNDFANELKELLKNKKTLYVRAKKVVSKLTSILKENSIDIDELITYQTKCNNCKELLLIPKNSIIIFSSPSTINCFFKLYSWDTSYKAIVIGKTTASYLPSEIPYDISPTQSMDDCINLAKKFV